MPQLPFNVWLLTLVQSLAMCSAPLVVFVGGLVGAELASSSALATLPVALLVIGTSSSTLIVSWSSQRWGRKRVFQGGALLAALGSLVCAFALLILSFEAFCFGVLLLGGSLAVVQQYRFAAMESVPSIKAPQAASCVLLGGLVSAILGPQLVTWGDSVSNLSLIQESTLQSLPLNQLESANLKAFCYGFVLLAIIQVVAFVMLNRFQNQSSQQATSHGEARPLKEIAKHPLFILAILSAALGYVIMSFIMTATPMSMHLHHGHSLEDTKWVIQSHILAMFLPSLFSGWLISRFGAPKLIIAGCLIMFGCIAVSYSQHALLNYWLALILLGIGWNFLFVSGTVLLPESYQDNEKYKVQACNDFSVFGAQSIASLSAGWVLLNLGWDNLVLICIPMIILLQLALFNSSRSSNTPDSVQT